MKLLIREQFEYTPKVRLDPEKNIFEISGESRPENSVKFYQPILDWLDEYLRYWKDNKLNNKEIIFKFEFEYFNSASSKCILDVIKKLDNLYREGISIKVKWYYVDELDEESGKEYYNIVKMNMIIPFEIVSKDEYSFK